MSITWYGSDARNLAMQEVVDAFATEHPDVQIESQPTTFDGYWDRLSVQAAGNNIACVAAMQSRYEARYEARGSLLPLDGLIEDGTIDVSGIPQDLLESQRAEDGHLYVIPFGIWYEGAVVNGVAIDELGLEPPAQDADWPGYLDWAEAAQPELESGRYAMMDRSGEITQFQAFAQSRGEDLFDRGELAFSRETMIEWLEMWQAAREAGTVPPAATTSEQYNLPAQQMLIAEGRSLITSTGDNNISDYQLALDENGQGTVQMAPSPTGGVPQVVGTNGWSISSNCENVRDSAQFIDYFVNSEAAVITMGGQGGLSPNPAFLETHLEHPETSETLRGRIALYQQLRDQGSVIDVWPDSTQQLVMQFRTASEDVAFGAMSPEDATEDFILLAETALIGF